MRTPYDIFVRLICWDIYHGDANTMGVSPWMKRVNIARGEQLMTKIPQDEAITAIKDLTPKAYQMLIYYYSRTSGWNFTDEEMIETLDVVNKRALMKYRRELIEKEYLWITGSDPVVYFVGRKSVSDYKHGEMTEGEE